MILLLFSTGCSKKNNPLTDPKPDAPFSNTRWKLAGLAGRKGRPQMEKEAFLRFDDATRRFQGSAGCNNLTGSYSHDGNHLRIGPAATTRMICPPESMLVEDELLQVLRDTDGLHISGDRLELLKGSQVIARFEAQFL
jgi:heat shock protein HslJ